jgi:DNA repair protein RadC
MAKGREDFSRHSIKKLPPEERPREKLLSQGSKALADSELLALLIRAGIGGCSSLELARVILAEHRTLRQLAARSPEELMRIRGIGRAKSVELVAAFEIGRRAQRDPPEEKTIIRSPDDAARLMIPRMRDATTEIFSVVILDSQNGFVREVELSSGTLNASLVHPREVYKAAIDYRAASIIVVHNHPSGNREPSREDIEITRQLAEAGKIVGIPLHDHIIIAGNHHTSLAERGFC